MNNKRKALCLLISVFLIISCLAFSACTPKTPDNTDPATEDISVTTIPTEAETTAPETTADTSTSIKLSASYIPSKAFDENGSEVSIYVVYGSSLRDSGGSLCFNEDGTFTTYIGVFGNVNNESGTYKILSDTEIEMLYNNDSTETAVITQVDSDGAVTELKMPHRGYEVVFTQA